LTKSRAERPDAHRPSEVLNTLKRLGFGAVVSVPDGWLGEMLVRIEQEPTMRLVRATHEEEALAIACDHVPKGRVTEPVFRGIGLSHTCTDRHRPIGIQVEQAATYAEEASCPFALLLSREDVQW
jgi:sulfopyruvate decarboxylase subunit alpha